MEVFFSRPGKKDEIKTRLITDIKYSKKRLLVSIYSLSDPDIAEAINTSKSFDKRIVYNHNVTLDKTTIKKKIVPLIQDESFINENCAPLGNSFGQMHHKFIITDNALWTGTYNLSFNANNNNWENMLRSTDKDLIGKFREEFDKMFVFSKAIQDKLQLNKCKDCNQEVEDPFDHFRIEYLTLHENKIIINDGFNSFYDDEKILVHSDDYDHDSFEVSYDIKSAYRAICLKKISGSKWAECYKCKEKGVFEFMPLVKRRVKNYVKNEIETAWTHLKPFHTFESHPDKTTCLECLHSIVVEESKLNSPDSTKLIPYTYPRFSEDPE